jgi:large conductance mechanosensitive channel
MKKLLKDFREFIMRGNVIDLAIGIIIGSAFSTLVNSIVNNLLMPPLGMLIGNVDFKDLFIVLKQGQDTLPADATLQMAQDAGVVTFNYGQFLTDLISFLLLAVGVFLIIKGIRAIENGLSKPEKEEEAAPTEKDCPYCYQSIPVEATRCPFCTSQLADSTGNHE